MKEKKIKIAKPSELHWAFSAAETSLRDEGKMRNWELNPDAKKNVKLFLASVSLGYTKPPLGQTIKGF